MSRVHSLKSIQTLPVSPEEAWSFFSNPANLMTITPPFLNLKVTGTLFGKETYAGQIIRYKVKPLFGIPLSWMTEIKHVERLKFFVDEQRRGPYSLWHHQHHFREVPGGVEMTDLVHYQLPLGPLGSIAHVVTVKRQLKKIFSYRYLKIGELFGSYGDEVNKVDIVGFLGNRGQLKKEDIGLIEVKDFFSFVAIRRASASFTVHQVKDQKIKNKKILTSATEMK